MHNDTSNKYKAVTKSDDFFDMEENEKAPNSPAVKLEGIIESLDETKSDESDDKDLMSPLNKLTVRVKSEWFQNKDIYFEYKEDSEIGVEDEKDNKITLICGAYHIGKDNDE